MDAKVENQVSVTSLPKFPSGKKGKQLIVGGLLLLALSGYVLKDKIMLALTPAAPDATSEKAVKRTNSQAVLTVQMTPVSSRPFERKLLVSGTVWAWDPVQVGSEINGLKVQSVLVDDGAQVHRNQVLAKLNSSILEAQLAKKRANLAGAQAALTKAIQPNRREDLTSLKYAYHQAQANVAQEEAYLARAEANYAEAAANAKRYGWLVSQGAVSAQDADNRTTLAKVFQAEVRNGEQKVKAAKLAAEQAHDRLTMGTSGGRAEDVAISKSQLAEISAGITELQSQLAQTVIQSPCEGFILKRSVHIGDIASSNKVMFDIVRDGRLELRANLPESDIAAVRAGQPVHVGDTSRGLTAKVREISPMIDQESRLGMVRIDLPKDTSLRPGNFIKGEISLGEQKTLAVPSSSVVFKDNRALVYTIDSANKAHMHFVEVGSREGDFIELRSGLKEGDQIVAKGAGFIKDGDIVNILPAVDHKADKT